jgi:hypothetical protein
MDMKGKVALCSDGIVGIIEGIKQLSWGLSYVGKTPGGKPWASRNPIVLANSPAAFEDNRKNRMLCMEKDGLILYLDRAGDSLYVCMQDRDGKQHCFQMSYGQATWLNKEFATLIDGMMLKHEKSVE